MGSNEKVTWVSMHERGAALPQCRQHGVMRRNLENLCVVCELLHDMASAGREDIQPVWLGALCKDDVLSK